MRFPYHGAGICLIFEDSVLIVKRAKKPFLNKWSFPGGGIEKGESELECAFREFKEETSFDLKSQNSEYIGCRTIKFPFFSYKTFYFQSYVQNVFSNNQLSELSEIKWVDFKDLNKYTFRPFSRLEIRGALKAKSKS